MGRDSFVYIKKGNTRIAVGDQLLLLGYKKYGQHYYCGNDWDYKHQSGVSAWFIDREEADEYAAVLWVRTQSYANAYDVNFQNLTLRHLKKYFYTYFDSDMGKNRYFKVEGDITKKGAENGCLFAIDNLGNKFGELIYALSKYPKDSDSEKQMMTYGIASPYVFNANVYLAYLCSIIEQYYKQTFIALLKFADNKESILKGGNKLSAYDLSEISDGKMSVEEAYANTLSFQNIWKISSNFRSINPKLDISSVLKKPYHNRKETLLSAMNRILELRHGLIHRMDIDLTYSSEKLLKDINDVKVSLRRTYSYICKTFNWTENDVIL